MVISDHGFDDAGKRRFAMSAQEHCHCLRQLTLSVGVHVPVEAAGEGGEVMGDYTDIEIIEALTA